MKVSRITLFIIVLLGALIIDPTEVHAWTQWGKRKQCVSNVKWRWGGQIAGKHKTAFSKSLSDWNKAQKKRKFSKGGKNAPGVLDSYYEKSGVYGYTYSPHTTCLNRGWVAKMNKYWKSSNDNWYRSVSGHELGHALGLGHEEMSWVLMSHRRNRYKVYKPTSDEIKGIKAIYK